MGFPTALSSGQKTILRGSGYWQRTFFAALAEEVVFQCEANETITDAPFKAFAWTNTLQGVYTDVWQGMTVYISETTSYLKDFKYAGYVRLVPSATEFRIDLNATILNDGDVVTVVRDVEFRARVREGDLVAGSVAYHNLPPVTTGLPSCVLLYDSDDNGTVTWTPSQSGIATADGATISSYAWAISGDGSSSISSASAQNPNFTFDAGYHYLVRLVTADSNAVSNFLITHVYAITRDFDAPVILPVVAGSVSQDLENGYTGSVTAYSSVSNLPYRTHGVIFAIERFSDNSSTPIVTNILMHGRLRSEDIVTEGSAESGRSMRVTYPLEGITSYMSRLKVPNDIVRHASSPDAWGEMVNPTPFRRAVYFLFAYTTLLNVCSFSAGDSLFDVWREGGEPISIDGGMALDALKTILDRIKAAPNYAPDGEIRCEITASYKSDRSGLTTIMDFTLTDVRSIGLNIDSSKQTGQGTGTGGAWNTVNNTFNLYTSLAPTVSFSDAPETRELTRELLQHDSTTTEAADELGDRTGNDLAFNNPKKLVSAQLRSAHRWLVATNYQRYTFTLATTDNVPGEALTTATKFQCQRVDITINTDGTYDLSADFVEETEFTDAQSIASQLPSNIPQLNPVLPVLSDDPAFPDEPLWAYPTDTPTTDELQPIGPYSAYLSYAPFPPNQAAEAAAKQGTTRCKTFQHLMRNGGTTSSSPIVTTAAAAYTIKVSGSGGLGEVSYQDLLTTGLGPKTHLPSVSYPFGLPGNFTGTSAGEYISTEGFGGGGSLHGTLQSGVNFDVTAIIDLGAETSITEVTWRGKRVGVTAAFEAIGFLDNSGTVITSQDMGTTDPDYGLRTYNTPQTGIRYVCIGVDYNNGDAWLDDITILYTGSGSGDAFYRFSPDDDNSSVLFDATQGFLLNGAKPAVIPAYNPGHSYEFPFTGTGFAVNASYVLSSYTGVENKALTIQICRD